MARTYDARQNRPLYYLTQVVWYLLDILIALLAFRFILKLLAANPSAGFTSFIYSITQPFAQPFLTVFRTTPLTEGSVFEWTTLLAMAVYWFIAEAIVRLVLVGRPVSTPEAADRLEEQDREIR